MIRKIFGVRGNNCISTDLFKRFFDLKFSNFIKCLLSVFLTLFSITSWASLSIYGEYGELPRTVGNFTLYFKIYDPTINRDRDYSYKIYEQTGSNPRVLIKSSTFGYENFDNTTKLAVYSQPIYKLYSGQVKYSVDIIEREFDCFDDYNCRQDEYRKL